MVPAIYLEIFVLLLGLIMVLGEAFAKPGSPRAELTRIAIVALPIIAGLTFFVIPEPATPTGMWQFYTADPLALFFKRIALITTAITLVLALEYRSVIARYIPGKSPEDGLGEFYALPVFVCAGLMFMASARDFIFLFVALELVTIAFYVLVAYMRRNHLSLEAGVKYLILGALSTGFLVYGITWIFGLTGETNFVAVAAKLKTAFGPHGALVGSETALLFGIFLVLAAIGFKIAAAPFQIWVPDVYQGAPTPVTAFLSVGSKAAGFIVLLRVMEPFLAVEQVRGKVMFILLVMAAATLLYGNLSALPQENLKRLFAYSSIAHAGYLLMAVAAIGSTARVLDVQQAVATYLAAYMIMTLLSFMILIIVARSSKGDEIRHFGGLSKRSPFLAFCMLVALASLAGVPLTVGFVGKFLVFKTAVLAGNFFIIGIGVVAAVTGFYYYFKVIAAMYWQEPAEPEPVAISGMSRIAVGALAGACILLGIFWQPVLFSGKAVTVVQAAAAH
jgi:NADH-quinone oxidoreductase subunit N